MIENERDVRTGRRGIGGDGQQIRGYDEVIAQARGAHGGQACQDRRAREPSWIGLDQHGMPDAAQRLASWLLAERRERVGHRRRFQVRPADHARDQVARSRDREQLGCLRGLGDRLYDHGRGHTGRGCQRAQLGF